MNSPPAETSRADILIVDDAPDTLRLLSIMLTEQGYKVRKALSGQMALNAVRAAPPDLILLDAKIPDIDGYEVCKQLKEDKQVCEIPVIFISGLDNVLDKVKAFGVGAIDYLTKPFQMEEVLVRVQTHLKLRSLQQELVKKNTLLQQEIADRDRLLQKRDRIEKALRLSEEKFYKAFHACPDSIAITTLDGGHYVDVNDSCVRIYGYSREEMIGKTGIDLNILVYLEERVAFRRVLQEEGVVRNQEFHFRTKSGEIRTVMLSAEIVELGGEDCVLAVTHDITERKQVEAALRQAEEKYRSIFENAVEGIFQTTADGRFVSANPALARIFGYESPQALVIHLRDVAQQVYVDSARRADFLHSVQVAGKVEGFESQVYRKDGNIIWISESAHAVRDRDGQLICYQGTVQDITQRKRAESALIASERKYRDLVETSQDIIWSVNAAGHLTFVNQAVRQIYGYEPFDAIGSSFVQFLPPERVNQEQEAFQRLLAGESFFQHETIHLAKDGRSIHLLLNAIALRDSQGNVIGATGTASDVTERKQAEDALRQSETREREKAMQLQQTLEKLQRTQAQLIQTEKMSSLGQMVAGVAHEINNPINFIYGNLAHADSYFQDLLQLLALYQQTYPLPPNPIQQAIEEIDLDFTIADLQKLLGSMKVGSDRIRNIVQGLRNFSRLDQARMKPVNLHEGINNTLMLLQHRLRQPGNRFNIEIVKDYGQLPQVVCYASQLNQVFMNVLVNAIDAVEESRRQEAEGSGRTAAAGQQREDKINDPPSSILHPPSSILHPPSSAPKVQIRTAATSDNTVAIWIIDNGPGMDEDVRSRIFDPFFTTKPVGQGTGLGLSISYQIVVERHNGQLTCQSSPEWGTAFTIELPIVQPDKSRTAQ